MKTYTFTVYKPSWYDSYWESHPDSIFEIYENISEAATIDIIAKFLTESKNRNEPDYEINFFIVKDNVLQIVKGTEGMWESLYELNQKIIQRVEEVIKINQERIEKEKAENQNKLNAQTEAQELAQYEKLKLKYGK